MSKVKGIYYFPSGGIAYNPGGPTLAMNFGDTMSDCERPAFDSGLRRD